MEDFRKTILLVTIFSFMIVGWGQSEMDNYSQEIINISDEEVMSLVDQNMEAGYHTAKWNADHHSSGVYFVKMIAGDYVNTQKLMLVK
jgi:hypothetical protein